MDSLVEVNTEGVQEIIIPFRGEFKIDAMGASGGKGRNGGSLGGKGAAMSGDFLLNEGEIYVVVGQMGSDSSRGASGGGGSFVWRYLVNGERRVAGRSGGGGGGADGSYYNTEIHGRVENAGGKFSWFWWSEWRRWQRGWGSYKFSWQGMEW